MFRKRRALSVSRHAERIALVVAACAVGAIAPAAAHAAPSLEVAPALAGGSTVAVGDVAQGTLTVSNHSTSPEDAGYLTLTELTLVPSCGTELADRSCVLAPGADPGVITIASDATGSGACGGNTFSAVISDMVTGKVTFTPAAPVVLGTGVASSTCTVTFTYTVNHVTTKDSSGAPGSQTDLVAFGKATASVNQSNAVDIGYSTVTVDKDTPELTARASPAVQVGGSLTAAGTLSGTDPDGSMTFKLFGPGDASCTTAVDTKVVSVDGNGTYNSPAVTATLAGTYRWTVSYTGDDDNKSVESNCNEPAAATLVNAIPAPPPPPPPPPPSAPGGGGGGTTPGGGGTTPGTGGTGGGTTPGTRTPGTVTRVKLDKFALTRRTFARATNSTALSATAAYTKKKKARKAAKKGTQIKFTLSAPALVTIVVERVTKGKRTAGYPSRCVKATKKLAKRKSCTIYKKVATIKRLYKTGGAKKLNFSGRAGRKPLAVGNYRLRAKATAGKGTDSAERRVTFKIVKR